MAKVLISLDDKLLRRVDQEARAAGLTRSAYIARLAERDLGDEVGPGARPSVRRALATLDRVFAENPTAGDSTELIRADRDTRR